MEKNKKKQGGRKKEELRLHVFVLTLFCLCLLLCVNVCMLQFVSGVSKHKYMGAHTHTHTQVYAGYCNLPVDLRWQDGSLHSSMGECTERSIHLRLSGWGRPAFFTPPARDAFKALEECHWPECPDLSWGPGCHTTMTNTPVHELKETLSGPESLRIHSKIIVQSFKSVHATTAFW